MKALVTGGAGFIGSHLVENLLKKNIEVIVYDDFSSGNPENLKSVQSHINIIRGDIRDINALNSAIKGVDLVFHLAALASVSQSIADPINNASINSTGTLNVLWAALKAEVSRVVISSSCAVYGDANIPPVKENSLPAPKSPYAANKLASEAYAESFYHSYGLETINLRYFNVYGSRQKANSDYAAVIPIFIDCYKKKKTPIIYGNGLQSRDFINVSDVAEANIKAALADKSLIKNRIFNIGTGNSTSLLELLEIISNQAGYKILPEFREARKGDILNSWADCKLAQEQLGFVNSIDLEKGIKELFEL